jgi:hypothetical protein
MEAFDRAGKWLSQCINHDSRCKVPNPNYMPRRLLNVGSSEECGPFLFEARDPAPYVCLSYCWGSNVEDVLNTTSENLQSHYQGVQFSSLPQTIRDAVILCRGLKLAYLWVDSLCIIQDDQNDWLNESAQMCEIYANSYLTIAAEEPDSCKLGFLGRQRYGTPQWQQRLVTDVPRQAGGPANAIFIRPIGDNPKNSNEKYSLDRRGWCLQESILPVRRLCFNGNEMVWQCAHRQVCECGHALWPFSKYNQTTDLSASLRSGHDGVVWEKLIKLYEDWRVLVENYSDRSLTQQMDKLSAISGLAKIIINANIGVKAGPGRYLAGLWEDDFLRGLTWNADRPQPELKDTLNKLPVSYRAPSWSWGSVNGSVRHKFIERPRWKYTPALYYDCSIDEVACHSLLHSDPTGRLTAAHAILTGELVIVELVVLDEELSQSWGPASFLNRLATDRKSLVRAENLWSFEIFLDIPRETCLRNGNVQSKCWIQGQCKTKCCLWDRGGVDGSPLQKDKELFYCFRLCSWRRPNSEASRDGHMQPILCFLVLRRSPRDVDAFERIGIGFWTSPNDHTIPAERRYSFALFENCEKKTIKIV